VQLLHEGQPIGMGRVVGDGGTAFQVVERMRELGYEPDLGKPLVYEFDPNYAPEHNPLRYHPEASYRFQFLKYIADGPTVSAAMHMFLELKDSKSSIRLAGLEGHLRINTYKGDLEVENFRGSFDLETYKGSARLDVRDLTGSSSVETYKGLVRLRVSLTTTFAIRPSWAAGRISSVISRWRFVTAVVGAAAAGRWRAPSATAPARCFASVPTRGRWS